jgi:hypothetical protein
MTVTGLIASQQPPLPCQIDSPPEMDHTRIPVTILTGFIGPGTTALVNRILTLIKGKEIA